MSSMQKMTLKQQNEALKIDNLEFNEKLCKSNQASKELEEYFQEQAKELQNALLSHGSSED